MTDETYKEKVPRFCVLMTIFRRGNELWERLACTRLGRLITDGESSTTVLKFAIIGTIGYLVNQFGLFLAYDTPLLFFLPEPGADLHLPFLLHPDARLFLASVIAVELSIISNFTWHERWTFRSRRAAGHWLGRLLRFNLTSLGSPLISVAVLNVLVPYFGVNKYVANTIGVLLGMSWNWTCNTRLIWRRKKPVPATRAELTPGASPSLPGQAGDYYD